ncbi:MAG: ABC transporter ATP-binding protein [Candidatus Cloacimonetes bacterium]|nr:ABC transporter ATP-binding protein [Candidatus Cloacimonadota bacterium]
MIKELLNHKDLSKVKLILVILFNLFEAFFLVSGIFLIFPFLKYLINSKQGVLTLFEQSEYQTIGMLFDKFSLPINLISLTILAILPMVLGQFFKFVKSINVVTLQQELVFSLRRDFLKETFKLSYLHLKQLKVGEIANVIAAESMRVGVALQYVLNFYSFLFIACIYGFMLIGISFKLSMVAMFLLISLPLVVKKQSKELKHLGRIVSSSNENIQSYLIERVKVFKKVKLLNSVDFEIKKFLKISRDFEDAYLKSGKVMALVDVVLEPLAFIISLILVVVGVDYFHLEFDKIVLFLFVIFKLNTSLRGAIQTKNQLNIYAGSYQLYKKYLDKFISNREFTFGSLKLEKIERAISLNKVSFSYTSEKFIENLDLEFLVGKTSALIGSSGSGKSTIIDLLLGFNIPQKGDVYFDDCVMKDLSIVEVRSKIGVVSQDAMLLYGSIRDNLLYGLFDKSEEDLRGACDKASLLDFVDSLPNGFDTQIGEEGSLLSGGQKQRLQLAQIFLQDPEVIILDEPTSALDSESEEVIVDTLKALHHSKTIIIIAHRLSTIMHSDNIIVMDKGELIDQGTHSQLLHNNEMYKKYFVGD